MGDWSEAMEDGVICRGCAQLLGAPSESGYCENCTPGVRNVSTQDLSHLDRAREWKERSKG